MPGPRDAAREFVRMYAATDVSPVLTDAEVDLCLTQARVVDVFGRLVYDPDYIETIWFTRAVVNCLEAKVAKASSKVDLQADGAAIYATQAIANLERLRKSWRSKMMAGSM